MQKKIIIGLIVILIALLGVILLGRSFNVSRSNISDTNGDTVREDIVSTDDIRITSPRIGEVVSSPLTISGEARGTWYFEASFSGRLVDAEGRTLTQFPIEAQSDWMTENFVPFSTTISWDRSVTGSGSLILENANPSGLPENAKSVTIPITFSSSTAEYLSLNVYFGKEASVNNDCSIVEPVARLVPQTQAVGQKALEELLKGPTPQESAEGYITHIQEGVRVQSLRIENGTAYVDFNAALNTGGSCRVQAIRSQITETLSQFPTVRNVVISVDGNVDEALQP